MEKNVDTIGSRIRTFRDAKSLRIADFARLLGISPGYLSEVENGKKQPGLDMIISLKRTYPSFDLEKLLFGNSTALPKPNQEIEAAMASQHVTKNTSIDFLEKRLKALEQAQSQNFLQIPLFEEAVSCGWGGSVYSDDHTYLTVDKTLLKPRSNYIAVRLIGTSMIEKGLYEADIVLIERRQQPEQGKIALVRLNTNELTLKTVKWEKNGEIWLIPANSKLKPCKIGDQGVEVLGVVALLFRAF